jgi:glycosyltransferase involved in cell wall biosynthesis
MKAKISIIICTYNGQETIMNCLDSITGQDYRNFEVLCIDGGSIDQTTEIIKEYCKKDKKIKLIKNPNKLPEGKGMGKWLGYLKSKGEIIGYIDQDNVLQSKEFLTKVIEKLRAAPIIGVAGGLVNDKKDAWVVRYVSLFGTDSFFAYRSLDFLKNLEGVPQKYAEFKMKEENMMLTGGNCFFYRKKDLKDIGGYSQDVLVVKKLISKYQKVGMINDATKHYAEKNMFALIKKKFKWGRAYFDKNQERFNYLPTTNKERFSFIKNLLFNLTIIPNFYYSMIIYLNKKDIVSFLFPFISFVNTFAYGFNFVFNR